jgi:purine-nucleoside phosphorylase
MKPAPALHPRDDSPTASPSALPEGTGAADAADAATDAIARSVQRLHEGSSAVLGETLPRVAVLLGSGWGPLADRVEGGIDIPYAELPAFPRLGVGGHAGRVRVGRIGGRPVWVLAGRKHAYETGMPDGMKGVVRTLAASGVKALVQTNAAGSLDAAMQPGALMLLSDHLNLVQRSPLVGEAGDSRFVDLGAAYDPALRAQARAAAAAAGEPLHEGVYAWVLGPQFETPAEIRMIRGFGAQAVGMSTVPETILARHAGLRVLALSLITNLAAGMAAETLSHAHTLATAQAAGARAVALLEAILGRLEV